MTFTSRIRNIIVSAAAATMVPAAVAAQPAAICGQWNPVDPPVGTQSAVTEVDAVSADDAWAFAYYLGLVRWDGSTWNQHPLPDLSDQWSTAWFRQFTAFGASHLFMVGNGETGPFSNDLFLVPWDGAEWGDAASVTLQPNIQGAPRNGAPTAVAAAAADDVWIVGITSSMGDGVNGALVLTVHWDGEQLTEYITPGVSNRQNNLLDAVAIAGDDAWAVGEYNNTGDPDGAFRGMTYHWGGTEWAPVPNPAQDIPGTHLYAVDAVASDDVWAGGDSPDGPLFMHWDGDEWTIVPSPATSGTIQQIAAIATDDVWAVDSPWTFPSASKYYHWDGVAWNVVPGPAVEGVEAVNRHGGLSAAGECDVWAVGSVQVDGQIDPFIERLTTGGATTAAPDAAPGAPTGITGVAPNPFNPRVEIAFTLERAATATVAVHDVRGRLVRTLSQGGLEAGAHTVRWDGFDDRGRAMPSGTYLVSLHSANVRDTRRMVLVR